MVAVEHRELGGSGVETLAGLANKVTDVEAGLREVWSGGLS